MSNPAPTLAQEVLAKSREQIETLIGRNWPEIQPILEKEEEVKLTLGVTITDRKAKPGEQADKDNRIKTTISFSERHTDSIEASLEDENQPKLPLAS